MPLSADAVSATTTGGRSIVTIVVAGAESSVPSLTVQVRVRVAWPAVVVSVPVSWNVTAASAAWYMAGVSGPVSVSVVPEKL